MHAKSVDNIEKGAEKFKIFLRNLKLYYYRIIN